jgi:hypothetical protein
MEKPDRSSYTVRKAGLHDADPADELRLYTPAERFGMVWPLTVEAWSLTPDFDAESGLQRHLVRVHRRGG